jgi:hypothetical protein
VKRRIIQTEKSIFIKKSGYKLCCLAITLKAFKNGYEVIVVYKIWFGKAHLLAETEGDI